MRKTFPFLVVFTVALIALVSSVGCGGGSMGTNSASNAQCNNSGFSNQTGGLATDAQLQRIWTDAQTWLATQPIEMNTALVAYEGAPPVYHQADPRAANVQPNCLAVFVVPDTPLADLPGVFHNGKHKDPTGMFPCPAETDGAGQYCAAYTAPDYRSVHIAASLILNPGTTGWEFENVILQRLGYSCDER
jgi:hypothetical protein